MQEMRESEGTIDLLSRMQLYGVLSKRPVGHASNKWAKRFFVIKDGYLLYYPDSERKELEKKKSFNIHPKGVLPLGGCTVEARQEQGHPFAIVVKSEEVSGNIVLAAESEFERDKWINMLRQSGRITWKNAQLGDAMIQQLEVQGLQMAKEKQDYFDQLQNEAMALHDEKLKTEELERVNEELEKEKQKMERLATDLKEEYEKNKQELEETLAAMVTVEEHKQQLNDTTRHLQLNLEELEKEKQKVLDELQERYSETMQIKKEKQNLSNATVSLQKSLGAIEDKMESIVNEKAEAEKRLQEHEQRAKQLEEEKTIISEHAEELQSTIKDLSAQKAMTENELKEEIVARLDAERRLQEAEASLTRLEKAVKSQGQETDRDAEEVREEMIGDVRTLKKFFENLAFEAKLDADKPIMIKNSIHARKTFIRRAKTMKFEQSRKRQSRASVNLSTTCPPDVLGSATAEFNDYIFTEGGPQSPKRVLDPRLRHSSVEVMTLTKEAEYV